MKKQFSVSANAKINLFLDVTARRDDGFHEVKSIMQAIDLADKVSVSLSPSDTARVRLAVSGADLPTDRSNIAYRAAELYMARTGAFYDAEIYIEKNIPIAAGLAGGSTDGAAVLKLLDMASPTPVGMEKLAEMGAELGSDVPFCVLGGTRLCTGRGEITVPVRLASDMHYVVAIGNESVSTPAAYAEIDKKYFTARAASFEHERERYACLCEGLACGDASLIAGGMYNIFEDVMLPSLPEASRLIASLKERGAINAIMSGSGPSVVALFDSAESARRAVEGLCARAFVCQSVT